MSDPEPTAEERNLRLRSAPPPVMRLSRRVIVAGSLVLAVLIGMAIMLAMRGHKPASQSPEESPGDARHNVADAITRIASGDNRADRVAG